MPFYDPSSSRICPGSESLSAPDIRALSCSPGPAPGPGLEDTRARKAVRTHQEPRAGTTSKTKTMQCPEGARSHPAGGRASRAHGEPGGYRGRHTAGLRVIPHGKVTLVELTSKNIDEALNYWPTMALQVITLITSFKSLTGTWEAGTVLTPIIQMKKLNDPGSTKLARTLDKSHLRPQNPKALPGLHATNPACRRPCGQVPSIYLNGLNEEALFSAGAESEDKFTEPGFQQVTKL